MVEKWNNCLTQHNNNKKLQNQTEKYKSTSEQIYYSEKTNGVINRCQPILKLLHTVSKVYNCRRDEESSLCTYTKQKT